MTDEDVIARAADLLGVRYWVVKPRREHHSMSYATHLRGSRAIALMTDLRPLMGARRQQQIERAIASWNPEGRRKITTEQGLDAMLRLAAGESAEALAEELGVSKWGIYKLRYRPDLQDSAPPPSSSGPARARPLVPQRG